MSSPIDVTEDHLDRIPPDIVRDWLPAANGAVLCLFTFSQYPSHKTRYFTPPNLATMLHEHSILGFDSTILLQLGPPINPSVSRVYQDAIKYVVHPVNSITLSLDPTFKDLVKLPIWIFDYWREMELALSC